MRPSGEQGFVLISALWLLVLGAALASLLMLRAMSGARATRATDDGLLAAHADDDAIETIATDMLFNGPRSRWWQVPASGVVRADGETIEVTSTSQTGLLDVDRADFAAIDGLLHDHGFAGDERARIIARIAEARRSGRSIASFADVAGLAGDLPVDRASCLDALLSPFGGRTTGAAPTLDATSLHVGDVLRLSLSNGDSRRVYAFRLTAASDRPYALLDWYDDLCRSAA